MKNKSLLYFGLILMFLSCSEYTPRPEGYSRFVRPQFSYLQFDHSAFSFSYTDDSEIDEAKKEDNAGYWFNILYPQYNAIVYCTYIPVTKTSLPKALDDSYQLAYSHVSKADGISQMQYVDSVENKTGIVYDIKGSVAVPVQFYITDNATNFLRGSLYFDQNVKADSVAPIVSYIRGDIVYMMESLKWKNKE